MKSLFSRFIQKKLPVITVVSGLPRSGTSLLMKMLEAGGIPTLTDNLRIPDEDNPKGYYEFERVKMLPKGDTSWLDDAKGKAVKIISALLPSLPESHTFQVIFVERNINEVLMSQKRMLIRTGKDAEKVSDEELSTLFALHLDQTNAWLVRHRHHIACIRVNYNCLLDDAGPVIAKINGFLGNSLDVNAMARVIDPTLYRNKKC